MWQSAVLHFSASHPVATGHFPDHPVIPGALLLDHVLQAIGSGDNGVLRAAKFLVAVRPGASLDLRWRTMDGGAVTFECRLPDQSLVATGVFEMSAAA